MVTAIPPAINAQVNRFQIDQTQRDYSMHDVGESRGEELLIIQNNVEQ